MRKSKAFLSRTKMIAYHPGLKRESCRATVGAEASVLRELHASKPIDGMLITPQEGVFLS